MRGLILWRSFKVNTGSSMMAPAKGGRQTPDAGARKVAWPAGCLAADEEREVNTSGTAGRLRPGAGSAGWSATSVAGSLYACANPPSGRATQLLRLRSGILPAWTAFFVRPRAAAVN